MFFEGHLADLLRGLYARGYPQKGYPQKTLRGILRETHYIGVQQYFRELESKLRAAGADDFMHKLATMSVGSLQMTTDWRAQFASAGARHLSSAQRANVSDILERSAKPLDRQTEYAAQVIQGLADEVAALSEALGARVNQDRYLTLHETDPVVSIEMHIEAAARRMSMIAHLGEHQEAVFEVIHKVRNAGGDEARVRFLIETILHDFRTCAYIPDCDDDKTREGPQPEWRRYEKLTLASGFLMAGVVLFSNSWRNGFHPIEFVSSVGFAVAAVCFWLRSRGHDSSRQTTDRLKKEGKPQVKSGERLSSVAPSDPQREEPSKELHMSKESEMDYTGGQDFLTEEDIEAAWRDVGEVKATTAYIFAHQILDYEFNKRLKFALKEWREDKEDYLRGRWIRAIVANIPAAQALKRDWDDPPIQGTEYEWPDGTRGLVVAIEGPYSLGEAIYCGVFWTQGQEEEVNYLLLEQGYNRTILAARRDGMHSNRGPAKAQSAPEFAELAKARRDRSTSASDETGSPK